MGGLDEPEAGPSPHLVLLRPVKDGTRVEGQAVCRTFGRFWGNRGPVVQQFFLKGILVSWCPKGEGKRFVKPPKCGPKTSGTGDFGHPLSHNSPGLDQILKWTILSSTAYIGFGSRAFLLLSPYQQAAHVGFGVLAQPLFGRSLQMLPETCLHPASLVSFKGSSSLFSTHPHGQRSTPPPLKPFFEPG